MHTHADVGLLTRRRTTLDIIDWHRRRAPACRVIPSAAGQIRMLNIIAELRRRKNTKGDCRRD
jgi:hypothetical protein